MDKQEIFKEIVDNRNYKTCDFFNSPVVGTYVITGIQAGNLQGEKGLQYYIGYVVQVRKKAGAFGTDMVLLRHPNGELRAHSNQSFFRVDKYWESRIKEIFDSDYYPEMEDYTKPYTLSGEFPEIGRVIEPSDNMPPQDNSPLCKITVSKADGSKEITVC